MGRSITRAALLTLLASACAPSRLAGVGDGEGSSEGTGGGEEATGGDGEGGERPTCDDRDQDGVPSPQDNAGRTYNPEQDDSDADGFGDVVDRCALTPSDTNTPDSNQDGVGNQCDRCASNSAAYNDGAKSIPLPAYMFVRDNPDQRDFDRDGIGDVCDNCVATPNCHAYGPTNPWKLGLPIDKHDEAACQTDEDATKVGDACEGAEAPDAAGPVGFGDADDFDQDGIMNIEDGCPRQPSLRVRCSNDGDCGADRSCASAAALDGERYCDHADSDKDGVGDVCDTCPFVPNFDQVTDGGMQEDDVDGDFVGAACETGVACEIRRNPRPSAFMEVSVNGLCCTTVYRGDGRYEVENGGWTCRGLCDPDGLPVTRDCSNEPGSPADRIPDGVNCRKLPAVVVDAPGMVELPPGCAAALEQAGLCDPLSDPGCDANSPNAHRRLSIDDIADPDELWSHLCQLPQWDQDFDGIGDACELKPSCEFAFDPDAVPYVDEEGKTWEGSGKYCSGEYACD